MSLPGLGIIVRHEIWIGWTINWHCNSLTKQKAGNSGHEFTWPADHSWPRDPGLAEPINWHCNCMTNQKAGGNLPGLRIIVGNKIWIGPLYPIIQNGHHHALPRYALLREKDLRHYRILKLTPRKIVLIESNAKCRHLKKFTCKGTLQQVFICLRPLPLLGFCLAIECLTTAECGLQQTLFWYLYS
jgi:hypothetical protein